MMRCGHMSSQYAGSYAAFVVDQSCLSCLSTTRLSTVFWGQPDSSACRLMQTEAQTLAKIQLDPISIINIKLSLMQSCGWWFQGDSVGCWSQTVRLRSLSAWDRQTASSRVSRKLHLGWYDSVWLLWTWNNNMHGKTFYVDTAATV